MIIIEKNQDRRRKISADISIRAYETKGRRGLNIIMRNDIDKYITSSGYIRFGISDSKLYFMQTDSRRGYKISERGRSGTRNKYMNIFNEELTRYGEKYGGDYFMKFAPEDSMGYIEGVEMDKDGDG